MPHVNKNHAFIAGMILTAALITMGGVLGVPGTARAQSVGFSVGYNNPLILSNPNENMIYGLMSATSSAGSFLKFQKYTAPSTYQDIFVIDYQGNITTTGAITGSNSLWQTNGTHIYNSNSGNVGIGTTTPQAPLHVNGGLIMTAPSPTLGVELNMQRPNASKQVFLVQSTAGDPFSWLTGTFSPDAGWSQDGTSYSIGSWTGSALKQWLQITRSGDVSIGAPNSDWTYAQYLNIRNSGNVGIGTTSPAYKLDVDGSVQIGSATAGKSFVFRDGWTGGGTYAALYTGGVTPTDNNYNLLTEAAGNVYFNAFGSGNMYIRNDNADILTIRDGGNVGVGSTSPITKFAVSGGTGNAINIAGGQIAGLNSTPLNSDHAVPLGYLQSNYVPIGSGSGGIGAGTSGQTLRHNGTSWVANSTLFNNGTNIGIGTTNPTNKLDVLASGANSGIDVHAGSAIPFSIRIANPGTDNTPSIGTVSTNKLNVITDNQVRMTILDSTGNGNVGIGITNPAAKLQVNGGLVANYTAINLTPNGDFELGNSSGFTNIAGVDASSSVDGKYAGFVTNNTTSFGTEYIPVDPNGYLYLEAWFKSTGAGGLSRLYFGTAAYDGNKTAINGNGGTYGYCAASNVVVPNTWTKYTCVLHGEGAGTYQFPAGTKYIRPLFLFNYSQDATFTTYVDGVRYVSGEYSELAQNGNVLALARSNSGNFGIGTTNPGVKLSVSGGTGNVINAGGGQINGLNSTPVNTDHAVPLGYLQANYVPIGSGSGGIGAGTSGQTLRHNGTSWVGNSVIYNNGTNVGVGVTNPSQKLEVGGSIKLPVTGGRIYFGSATDDYLMLQDVASPNPALQFIQDSGSKFVIQGVSGNVGIGTTNPGYQFQLEKASPSFSMWSKAASGWSPNDFFLWRTDASGNYLSGSQVIAQLMAKAKHTGGTESNPATISFYQDSSNAAGVAGSLHFATSDGSSTSNAERMVIQSNGNVGIATTSPIAKLAVSAGTGNVVNVGGGQIAGLNSTPTNTDHAVPLGYLQSNYVPIGSGSGGVGSGTSGQTLRHNGTSWVANSVIYNNGTNVGIGTTNALDKLHVNGDIRLGFSNKIYTQFDSSGTIIRTTRSDATQEGLFRSNGWGDFTFSKSAAVGYDLNGQSYGTGNLLVSGNIGIGTTGPNSKLEIQAGSSVAGYFQSSADVQITVRGTDSWSGITFDDSGSVTDYLWFNGGYGTFSFGGGGSNVSGKKLHVEGGTTIGAAYRALAVPTNGLAVEGSVGIGTTNPGAKLDVAGSLYNNSSVTHTALAGAGNVIVMADNNGTLYATSSAAMGGGSLPLTGGTLSGNLNMGWNDIQNVDKLTVNTIDPLYDIGGKNYSTYASSVAGGVKEEYIGRLKISRPAKVGGYENVLDLSSLEEGSDLWVWREVVDFSPENVDVLITPYGKFASVYYLIRNNSIIFRSDRPAEVSFRLVGKRFDWRKWPTFGDQSLEGYKVR